MERNKLSQLMIGDSEGLVSCRSALEAGAFFKIWDDDVVPVQHLISIYARRERNARRRGQPSIGFVEAIDDLRAYEGGELVVGYVDDRLKDGYYFQIFLKSGLSGIVACFGVKHSREEIFY